MTGRIYFEKFVSEDDYKYFSKLAFNEEVMAMNFGRIFTLEEAAIVYKGIMKRSKQHEKFGDFKVFEKDTNNFMGIGTIVVNDDFTEAEIEYMLLPEYWRKRFGSEIVEQLLKKAEEIVSIQKVTAIIAPNNIGSKKILLNNGFVSVETFTTDDGSLAETFSKKINNIFGRI